MKREEDYNKRFVDAKGKNYREDVNNPQMGCRGEDVFRNYAVTEDNKKFSLGLDQSGTVSLTNDGAVEIIAGEEGDGGEDMLFTPDVEMLQLLPVELVQ